jgi:hypothetical protein
MSAQPLLSYASANGIPWRDGGEYDSESERVNARRRWLCRNARHAVGAGHSLVLRHGAILTESEAIEVIMGGGLVDVVKP